MKVLKFGGTSVGNPDRMKAVAALISNDEPKIVVLSATSGTTDQLVAICKYLSLHEIENARNTIGELEFKFIRFLHDLLATEKMRQYAIDYIVQKFQSIWRYTKQAFTSLEEREIIACGEQISTALMSMYLEENGTKNVLLSALDFMRTDEKNDPDTHYIEANLNYLLGQSKDTKIFITQGFICKNHKQETDNLKRGGSDYSATLIGAAINAREIQIWTDIDGMHNNDPRCVAHTSPVRFLNFAEAEKLAYFGAKILHPKCIQPAKEHNIPVRLLNAMNPSAPGTLISTHSGKERIKAVAAKDGITYIKIKSLQTMPTHLFLKEVFNTFANFQTSIDLISTSDIGVSVAIEDSGNLSHIISELRQFSSVAAEQNMIIVCVVGDLKWQNTGYEAEIISALKNIPVRMISYGGSNCNLSLVMKSEDKKPALQMLSSHLFTNRQEIYQTASLY